MALSRSSALRRTCSVVRNGARLRVAVRTASNGLYAAALGDVHAGLMAHVAYSNNWHVRSFSSDGSQPKSSSTETTNAKIPEVTPTTLRQPTTAPAAAQASQATRAPGSLPVDQLRLLPPLAEVPGALANLTVKALKATGRGVVIVGKWTGGAIKTLVTDPAAAKAKSIELWHDIKHEAHHYWVGSKLLVAEIRTSAGLLRKLNSGTSLTRRERLQLKRTLSDLLRMVPFVLIVIIPFAELGLPVLLKLFPNMLPSQFEKAEVRQEAYKRSLNARLELHGVLQEILADRTRSRAANEKDGATGESAAQLLARLEAVRRGDPMPPDAVVAVARLFKDELTTDTLPRGQLATLAKYMGVSPYSPELVLRTQLRGKLKELKEDDRLLASEGTGHLSREELKAACEERGMRAVGMTVAQYRAQLDEWLDLSVKKEVPATLLLLSRAFQIASVPATEAVASAAKAGVAAAGAAAGAPAAASPQVQGLQESISSIDPRTVAEALAQAETVAAPAPAPAAAASPDATPAQAAAAAARPESKEARAAQRAAEATLMEAKLESLELQNELIAAEKEAAEASSASEKASQASAQALAAAEAAAVDPARAAELAALRAAADAAAAKAKEKARAAEAKKAVVIRLRAGDAARAAMETSAPAPAPAQGPAQGPAPAPRLSPADEAKLLAAVAETASMGREKSLLSRLKAVQARIDAEAALGRGRITDASQASQAPAAAAPEDRTAAILRRQLASLQAGLEKDIAARSSVLSSALATADTDKDALVDQADLAVVLGQLLKGVKSEEAAAALIRKIDQDGDGHITLVELEKFLDRLGADSAEAQTQAKAQDGPAKAATPKQGDAADSDDEAEAKKKTVVGGR